MDVHIDALRLEDDRLIVVGQVATGRTAAGDEGSCRVALALLRPGRLQPVRHRISAMRLKTRPAASAGTAFTAALDLRKLRRGGRWRAGTWELYAFVRAGGAHGARKVFSFDDSPPAGVELLTADGTALVRTAATARRELTVEVATRWAAIRSHRLEGEMLELSGEVGGVRAEGLELRLREAAGARERRYAVDAGTRLPRAFAARLPVADVAPNTGDEPTVDPCWELFLVGGSRRVRIALAAEAAEEPAGSFADGRELVLSRTPRGDASLVVRTRRAVLTGAAWDGGGRLALEGDRLPHERSELVLFSRERLVQHAFPAHRDAAGRFRAVATPAAIDSLAGSVPLPEGSWHLCARRAGEPDPSALASVSVGPSMGGELPLSVVVDHKRFALRVEPGGDAVLSVSRDLDDDERGPHNQRELRRTAYESRRTEPLLDTVVYSSYRGRQYSDSPRAIHEELVRRGAPFEHLWVVRDGACVVPKTAKVLRDGSRDHYEALARTRYFITNDHFPEWFERRLDQTCVQTWHGTPLKQLGFDVSRLRGTSRKFERGWSRQLRNWQYVVSPNRFSTPILKRAYELDPQEMLETGYPRDDVLAGAGRELRTRQLRERLGLPDGVRVVLYAPTYRDQVRDLRGRYRLDLRLDLDRLRDAVGPDTVLLFRKHHYIVDDVPTTPDGFVRDVSSYPDGTELLLAADVLVTDYSSMIVDFANTGRPVLLFTYDIAAYRDEIRGFYIDFEATMPGPLLTTSDEVVEALQDVDGVRSQFAARYDAFTAKFCELDDGAAAARVVDRLFDL